MGTEGIMGLFPEIPAFPAFPAFPENSPKKAKPFKLKSVVRFARINCLETAGTTETAESIFDTQFRCRLFRLCGLFRPQNKILCVSMSFHRLQWVTMKIILTHRNSS